MRISSTLSVLLIVSLFSAGLQAAERQKIAVLQLSPEGVSTNDAATVSEFLRTDLVKTRKFTVIERDRLQDILKEQQLSLTGLTESQQAEKIGKLLECSYILVGSLGKLGEKYFLNVRVVKVETGETTIAERDEAEKLEGLSDLSKSIADQLAGRKTAKFESRFPPFGVEAQIGFYPVSRFSEADLQGADTSLVKKVLGGTSAPFNLRAGLYFSKFYAGYSSRTVNVARGKSVALTVTSNAGSPATSRFNLPVAKKLSTSDLLIGYRIYTPGRLNTRIVFLSYRNVAAKSTVLGSTFSGVALGSFGRYAFSLGDSDFDLLLFEAWEVGYLVYKKPAGYSASGTPMTVCYGADFGIGGQWTKGVFLGVTYNLFGLTLFDRNSTPVYTKTALNHGLEIKLGYSFDLQTLFR